MIDTALDLVAREAAILVLLGLLGSAPASVLPGPVPMAARAAAAPAFGLALAAGVMLSAAQLMPMATAAWAVLLPLSFVSTVVAAWVWRTAPPSSPAANGRAWLWLALALVVPLAALNAPLVDQRTVGPAGYFIADGPEYASQSSAFERSSWNADSFDRNLDASGLNGDRALRAFLDGPFFQTGTAPMQAAVNEMFGSDAVDSQSALLVAMIAIGSLGSFAFLLSAIRIGWASALGAVLFAGPVTYQLFIDSSQASLAALALLGPLALVGGRLAREPVKAGLLFGVLGSGVASTYPSYLPMVAGSVLIGFAVLVARGGAPRPTLRVALAACGAAVVAAALVAPFALAKDISYGRAISDGALNENFGEALYEEPLQAASFGRPLPSPTEVENLPRWDVPATGGPAWLAGSRDIYYVPSAVEPSLPSWLAFNLVFPLLLLGMAVLGAVRFPVTRVLLCAAAMAPLVAAYSSLIRDCGYCGQRNLLPLAQIAALLAAAGIAAAAARPVSGRRLIPLAVLAAVLVAVPLQRDSVLARRLTEGGALLGQDARAVFSAADDRPGPIALEGIGAGPPHAAPIESALLRVAAQLRFDRPPVIDWKSLPSFSYFPDDPPRLSDLDPRYRFVLTRLAGVDSPRPTIGRRGPYALQRRQEAADVTITSGVVADLAQRDPSGDAWLAGGPVTFTVAAPGIGGPLSLHVTLRGPAIASLRVGPPDRIVARDRAAARLCLPVPADRPISRTRLRLSFEQVADTPPPDSYGEIPVPGKGLRIAALGAAQGGCAKRPR